MWKEKKRSIGEYSCDWVIFFLLLGKNLPTWLEWIVEKCAATQWAKTDPKQFPSPWELVKNKVNAPMTQYLMLLLLFCYEIIVYCKLFFNKFFRRLLSSTNFWYDWPRQGTGRYSLIRFSNYRMIQKDGPNLNGLCFKSGSIFLKHPIIFFQ